LSDWKLTVSKPTAKADAAETKNIQSEIFVLKANPWSQVFMAQ